MELHDVVPVILVSNEEYWLPYSLKAIIGKFPRYVIYDVGSQDRTRDIIDWFIPNCGGEIFYRTMPMVPREVQGAFRNSMIAEAKSNYYLIVDGDEVWSEQALDLLPKAIEDMYFGWQYNKIYGVVRRKELNYNLTHEYVEQRTHHRIYSREAYWLGTHPGEVAGIGQKPATELDFPNILVHHFHNTLRSSTEDAALKRMERKSQKTYHPGAQQPFNLLDELPILRARVEHFPVSPLLEKLWDAQ